MTSFLPHIDEISKIFMAFERFVPEYHHVKFGGDWTTNKGEAGGHNVPPAYILLKQPSLNRINTKSKFVSSSYKYQLWRILYYSPLASDKRF